MAGKQGWILVQLVLRVFAICTLDCFCLWYKRFSEGELRRKRFIVILSSGISVLHSFMACHPVCMGVLLWVQERSRIARN